MWLLRTPAVYRPQGDTRLLAEAMTRAGLPGGARVLDIGTGSGALAVTAARAGAQVTALDVSRGAVRATRFNTAVRRLDVRVARGDVFDLPDQQRFDVVLANPPYVPSVNPAPPKRGRNKAWDAGHDGRAVLDPLCDKGTGLLATPGTLLLVHSVLCNVEATLARLRGLGLQARVVAQRTQQFGPVLRERAPLLEERGLIEPGQRYEQLVVIRGDRAATTP